MRLLGSMVASVLVAAGLTLTPAAAHAADPTITITPSPVAPDGVLTVAGTGCAAASPVSLRVWDTGGGAFVDDSTTADASGGFSRGVPLGGLFEAGSEIGAVFYCGALWDESVPHALGYLFVASPATGVTVSFDPASPRYGTETVASIVSTPATAAGTSTLSIDGVEIGDVTPVDGVAELTLPAGLGVGDHVVGVEFDPADAGSETATAESTLTVRKALSTATLRLSDTKIRKGEPTTARIRVRCATTTPTGVIVVRDGPSVVRSVTLKRRDDGRKSVRLTTMTKVGRHSITVVYRGSGTVLADSSRRVVLEVTR